MKKGMAVFLAAAVFVLMGAMAVAGSAAVAGIELPNEDDVLVQMLLDDQIPMEERIELINETLMHIYPETLPVEERSRGLMQLVKRTDAPLELRYLAAATMVEANVAPPELGEYLVSECKSEDISREWLSFCLRLLDSAYFRGDLDLKTEVVDILVTAARRERSEVAGTALLALWRISEKDVAVAPALRTLTRALFSTKDGDFELMIAALQVAASLGDTEAMPVARRLAHSDKYGVRLRLAGVNTIVALGNSNDIAKLSDLRSDKDIGTAVGGIIANRAAQQQHFQK